MPSCLRKTYCTYIFLWVEQLSYTVSKPLEIDGNPYRLQQHIADQQNKCHMAKGNL